TRLAFRRPMLTRLKGVSGCLLAAAAVCLLAACGGHKHKPGRPGLPATVPAATPTGIHKIKHLIIIMQENRSFDSYFGTYPGADGPLLGQGEALQLRQQRPAGGLSHQPDHRSGRRWYAAGLSTLSVRAPASAGTPRRGRGAAPPPSAGSAPVPGAGRATSGGDPAGDLALT